MATNKDATIRYRIIDRCLAGGKVAGTEDLMEQIYEHTGKEISLRTLRDDIRTMKTEELFGYAPIEYDRGRNGYYYTDTSYSFLKVPLSDEELEALQFAASIFDLYKENDIFGKIPGAVQKLVGAVDMRKNSSEKKMSNFIEFETAPLVKGTEFLEVLGKSIQQKQVLQLKYRSFDAKEPREFVIHPYYLKEYRNRWYLIGLEDDRNEVITLGLERMEEVVTQKNKIFRTTDFNPKEYFKNSIGITVNNKQQPETVEIWFSKFQANYIKTQVLHSSQEVLKEDKDGITVRYTICPTFEFRSQLLSYGANCEVLKPASLRKEMQKLIEETNQRYQSKK